MRFLVLSESPIPMKAGFDLGSSIIPHAGQR